MEAIVLLVGAGALVQYRAAPMVSRRAIGCADHILISGLTMNAQRFPYQVKIRITPASCETERGGIWGVDIRVFHESLLPAGCVVCGQPQAEVARWDFMGSLPRATRTVLSRWRVILLAVLAVLAAAAWFGVLPVVIAAGTPLGLLLGLLAAGGWFRHSRNVLRVALCREHAELYRRYRSRRTLAGVSLIAMLLIALFVAPQLITLALLSSRKTALLLGLIAALLTLLLVAASIGYRHMAARRHALMGLKVCLSENEDMLQIDCRHARLLQAHRPDRFNGPADRGGNGSAAVVAPAPGPAGGAETASCDMVFCNQEFRLQCQPVHCC